MVKIQNILKARRAVGGLISLIALIIVFGIASLAFLEINTTHADFVLNSINVNDKQFNKIKEHLNFTITNTTGNPTDYYTVDVSNIWNDQSIIESHVTIKSDNQISFQRYLNETTVPNKENIIGIEETNTLIFTDTNSTHGDETIIFVTANGNKCILSIPAADNALNRMC